MRMHPLSWLTALTRFRQLFARSRTLSRPKQSVRLGWVVIAWMVLTSTLGYRFYDQPRFGIGTIAPLTIAAPATAKIKDPVATAVKRQQVQQATVPALVVDPQANQAIWQHLKQLWQQGETLRNLAGPFPYESTSALSTEVQGYIRQLPEPQWQFIRRQLGTQLLTPGDLRLDVIQQLIQFQQNRSSGAVVALINTIEQARQGYQLASVELRASQVEEENPVYNLAFLNLTTQDWQNLKEQVSQILKRMLAQGISPGLEPVDLQRAIVLNVQAQLPTQTQELAIRLLSTVMTPNLIRDDRRTQEIAQQAAAAVQPVFASVQQGQPIVRQGETIDSSAFALLDHFDLSQRQINWIRLLQFSGAVGIGMALFGGVAFQIHLRLRSRDYFLIVLLIAAAPLAIALTENLTALPAIGLLLGSFYGATVGLTVTTLVTLLLPAGTGIAWRVVLPSAMAGMLAGILAGKGQFLRREAPQSRESLALIGILIGVVQGGIYLLIHSRDTLIWSILLPGAGLATLSGIAWSVIALGISPYLERLFDLVTPIRLAELANPNQPLLKRLAQEAPGTFQHTLFVATLAQAASQELGCDVELVRAGTLYHDVGKLHDPAGFIENQMGGPNKHDAIADPWRSAQLIKKHVSEGLVLARSYHLPSAIQAFIPEHQGTIKIAYFYHQAQQRAQQDPDCQILESDFCYDGPIPQSRETGIVMLADACEAALRALSDATPEEALCVINKILKARWQEGQLVDSGLTRDEMTIISKVFVRVWQQFHHKRILYPKST